MTKNGFSMLVLHNMICLIIKGANAGPVSKGLLRRTKMKLLLLMFCCLLGVGSASSQEAEPSNHLMIPSMDGVERELAKINENLELLTKDGGEKSLTKIGDMLQLIADRLLNVCLREVPNTATTQSPTDTTQSSPVTTRPLYTTTEPPATSNQPPLETCTNGSGDWSLVARIDMTDPNQHCPSGFSQRIGSSNGTFVRLCGRSPSDPIQGCLSTTFNVTKQYTQVQGRIIGYQYGAPFAFYTRSNGIDGAYVDGFSITQGQPREHIWTFAAGSDEHSVNSSWVCPCISPSYLTPTSFVGRDYFCGTANHDLSWTYSRPFYDHPLWDVENCGSSAECCNFHNPPWFCKTLPTSCSAPIELRQCNGYDANSDTPFQLVEIWVR